MRRSIRTLIVVLALFGSAPTAGWCAGTHNFEFLRVGISARTAGMGGTCAALSDGMAALDHNAAGLSHVRDSEAMAAYMRYPEGVQAGWVAIGRSIPSGWRFGFGVKYLSYGSMTRTSVTDPAGQSSETFSASDIAVKIGAAYPLAEGLRVGLGASYISGTIDSFDARAVGLDGGILLDLPVENLRLGASLSNLQLSATSYLTEKISLPSEGRIGIGYETASGIARLGADAVFGNDEDVRLTGGGEIRISNSLWLRAGMDSSRRDLAAQAEGWGTLSSVTWGLGIVLEEWAMGYSISPFGGFGTIHRLSIRSTL